MNQWTESPEQINHDANLRLSLAARDQCRSAAVPHLCGARFWFTSRCY